MYIVIVNNFLLRCRKGPRGETTYVQTNIIIRVVIFYFQLRCRARRYVLRGIRGSRSESRLGLRVQLRLGWRTMGLHHWLEHDPGKHDRSGL